MSVPDGESAELRQGSAGAILLDLLMATMDSISTWSSAAGDRERGLAWRDAVTELIIAAGHYVPYDELVVTAAADLKIPADAPSRLYRAWADMRPWPDARALHALRVPYAFVTNCSKALAIAAAERSGLNPTFTLSAEEAGWYKPRSEIYRLAAQRIGAPMAHVHFVAGAAYDAIGALEAGCRSVLVARRAFEARPPAGISLVHSLDDALAVVAKVSGPVGC